MNLATNLERSAYFFPDRPAVSENGVALSYAQLNEQANRIATKLLEMGLKNGDHVGLCAANSPEWLSFYFGVLKAGGVAVTLSSLLASDEFRLLVGHAKMKFLYTSESRLGDLQELK